MKKIISIMIICLVVTGVLPFHYSHGEFMNSKYLDVKVGKPFNTSDYITLSSDNGFYFYNKDDKRNEIFQVINTSIIVSNNDEEGLDILDSNNNILTTVPGDGSVIIGAGSFGDSIIQVGKNRYRDFIGFLVKNDGILLINHIEIENYLYGVVPKEIGASFPMESIKAQAVAARTYALSNINKHKNEGFNLCDTTHCQVYGAMDAEHSSTNQAVNETRNMVVYYKGKLAETTFHSNNGGYTESNKDAWGGAALGYLIAKEDKFSLNSPNSSWTVKLTLQEMSSKLISGGIDVGELIDMEVLEISEGKRVLKLKIKGSSKDEIISGSKLRTILGNNEIKSTFFNINKEGISSNVKTYIMDGNSIKPIEVNLSNATIIDGRDVKTILKTGTTTALGENSAKSITNNYATSPTSFTFEGKGYGHGVGMSQYGAMEMAKQGYNFEEILKYYYTGVDIINSGQ